VVGNTRYADLRDEDCWCKLRAQGMAPIAYVPIAQNPNLQPWAPVIVRSSPSASSVAPAIAKRVASLNPDVALQFIELKSQIRGRLVVERMMAWLAGAFGLLAIVIVTVGLYGIIAYLAVSRTNEIGIRLSLGATRGQIVQLVLRDSVWLLAAGLAIGLPLAAVAMRGAETMLFGLSPTDLPTVAAAAGVLCVVAALAGWIPARRAARVDPLTALRCE
jgi:putative ABC transport system permease protein